MKISISAIWNKKMLLSCWWGCYVFVCGIAIIISNHQRQPAASKTHTYNNRAFAKYKCCLVWHDIEEQGMKCARSVWSVYGFNLIDIWAVASG